MYAMLFFALYVTNETHNSLFDLSKDFFHPGHKAAHPREHSGSVPVAKIFSISRKNPENVSSFGRVVLLKNAKSTVRYLH